MQHQCEEFQLTFSYMRARGFEHIMNYCVIITENWCFFIKISVKFNECILCPHVIPSMTEQAPQIGPQSPNCREKFHSECSNTHARPEIKPVLHLFLTSLHLLHVSFRRNFNICHQITQWTSTWVHVRQAFKKCRFWIHLARWDWLSCSVAPWTRTKTCEEADSSMCGLKEACFSLYRSHLWDSLFKSWYWHCWSDWMCFVYFTFPPCCYIYLCWSFLNLFSVNILFCNLPRKAQS